MLKNANYRKTLRSSASSTLVKAPVAKPAKLSRWHAVSIAKGKECCAAVEGLGGQRWLSSQAPQLPVKGCDMRDCECRYRHHDSRRAKLRREEDQIGMRRVPKSERRTAKRGRRADDP
jgi:hypothetical protein